MCIVARAEREVERSRYRIAMADVADKLGIDVFHLTRAFNLVVGLPPGSYFRLKRMSLARQALLRGEPARCLVKQVALEFGFNHLGRFSDVYRRLYGEYPSETLRRSTR